MKLLVVEDLNDSYSLIEAALSRVYNIVRARTLAEAMVLLEDCYDLALIDIALPDGDGFQVCDMIRSHRLNSHIPIIFLTANNTVESRITGFASGGDDYISKPFNFVELKARIEAKLNRPETRSRLAITAEGISIDLRSQRALIVDSEPPLDLNLTPIEFKILNLLMLEPDKAFSRDEILNRIWGENIYIYPRCIDTHISKLRTKLNHKALHIKSVHGVGYKFFKKADDSPLLKIV